MKRIIGVLVAALLAGAMPIALAASVKPGTTCKKAGSQQTYKGKLYTCIKLGKKLYWDNGKKMVVSSTPTANPKPSPTPSFSSSPTPSASKSSVTPNSNPPIILLESFFGKNEANHCWIANRFKNPNDQVSPRYVHSHTVISDKGLIMAGSNPTYVPSLPPSSEYWSYQRFFCNEDRIGSLASGKISTYNYFGKNEIDRTSPKDLPRLISLIDKKPGVNYITQGKFEIRIENQSIDKILDKGTLVSIIFFNQDGKPVSGASAQLSRSIPPQTVGTLDFPDFDIGIYEIPKFERYIVSIAQLMCQTNNTTVCSY